MKNKESLATGYIILLFANFLLIGNMQTKVSLVSELLLFYLFILYRENTTGSRKTVFKKQIQNHSQVRWIC